MEILRINMMQIEADKTGKCHLAPISVEDSESGIKESKRLLNVASQGEMPTVCEDSEEMLQQAWDDVSGRSLDAAKGFLRAF